MKALQPIGPFNSLNLEKMLTCAQLYFALASRLNRASHLSGGWEILTVQCFPSLPVVWAAGSYTAQDKFEEFFGLGR